MNTLFGTAYLMCGRQGLAVRGEVKDRDGTPMVAEVRAYLPGMHVPQAKIVLMPGVGTHKMRRGQQFPAG